MVFIANSVPHKPQSLIMIPKCHWQHRHCMTKHISNMPRGCLSRLDYIDARLPREHQDLQGLSDDQLCFVPPPMSLASSSQLPAQAATGIQSIGAAPSTSAQVCLVNAVICAEHAGPARLQKLLILSVRTSHQKSLCCPMRNTHSMQQPSQVSC